jgi:hypothetical protein
VESVQPPIDSISPILPAFSSSRTVAIRSYFGRLQSLGVLPAGREALNRAHDICVAQFSFLKIDYISGED